MIVIYGTEFSAPTGRRLALALRGVFTTQHPTSLPAHEATDHVICWGRTAGNDHYLNHAPVLNKIDALSRIKEAGVNTPPTLNKEHYIIKRPSGKRHLRFVQIPVDAIIQKKIPKLAEYRVHAFNSKYGVQVKKLFTAQEKTPPPLEDNEGWEPSFAWNHRNGYIMHKVRDRRLCEALADIGLKAVETLGYDFGAVDIVQGEDNFWVLEVNSAPALSESRIKWYAKRFTEIFNS